MVWDEIPEPKYQKIDFFERDVREGRFVKVDTLYISDELSEDISARRILWEYVAKKPIVILTAWRKDRPRWLKQKLTQKMIRKFWERTGIGAFRVKGVGQEKDEKTGETEESIDWGGLFVYREKENWKPKVSEEEFLKIAKELSREYGQDYLFYGDGKGKFYSLAWSDEENDYVPVPEYTWDDIKEGVAQYYTLIKGKVPFHAKEKERKKKGEEAQKGGSSPEVKESAIERVELYAYSKDISNWIEGIAVGHYIRVPQIRHILEQELD